MKRDATQEESEKAIEFEVKVQGYPEARADRDTAIAEGYKDEVCGKCGTTFLAHKHFVRCPRKDCDMKGPDSKSVLDMVFPPDPEEASAVAE